MGHGVVKKILASPLLTPSMIFLPPARCLQLVTVQRSARQAHQRIQRKFASVIAASASSSRMALITADDLQSIREDAETIPAQEELLSDLLGLPTERAEDKVGRPS